MDKILSASVDDSVIRRIGSLARQLRASKKRIIEEAIEMYAVKVETDGESDILDQSLADAASAIYRKWHPSHGLDVNDAFLAATTNPLIKNLPV